VVERSVTAASGDVGTGGQCAQNEVARQSQSVGRRCVEPLVGRNRGRQGEAGAVQVANANARRFFIKHCGQKRQFDATSSVTGNTSRDVVRMRRQILISTSDCWNYPRFRRQIESESSANEKGTHEQGHGAQYAEQRARDQPKQEGRSRVHRDAQL